MHVILLVLGLAAIAAGAVMIGFGIPINEFGLGNTLIAAGTTASVGGLLLIGLWAILTQLRRLTAALQTAPAAKSLAAPGAPAAEIGAAKPSRSQQGPTDRAAAPATERPGRGPAGPPVGAPAAAVLSAPSPDMRAPEPNSASWREEVPQFSREAAGLPGRSEDRSPQVVPDEAEPFVRASREGIFAPEPQPQGFDEIWPSTRARGASSDREGRYREEPPERTDDASSYAYESKREEAYPAHGPEEVTVLKSGVISGMAYTLYSDGSIKAELPQGTLHFESIEDLRAYLDDHG